MNFRKKVSILLSCFITCSAASGVNNVKAMDSFMSNPLVAGGLACFSLYNLYQSIHNAGYDRRAVEYISSCCKKRQLNDQSQEIDENGKNDIEQQSKEKQD